MSGKCNRSSRKSKVVNTGLDRAFDPAIEKRARQLAQSYRLVLEPDADVGFIGRGLEMPTIFADAPTADECVSATREALTTAIATMLEMGLRPPTPVAKGARQAQINVRLTSEEKLILEDSARRAGFRGLSDFMRAAALNYLGGPVSAKKRVASQLRKRVKSRGKKSA